MRLPLLWRVFLGTALVVAAILGGSLLLTARATERAASAAAERGIAAIRSQVTAQLDGNARGLLDGARVFAQNPGFRSLVASGARDDALDQAREAAERLAATWTQVTDARGVRLAKSDAPDAPAEPLGESALIARALGGEGVAAFGVDADGALFHAVAVPVEGATPGRRAGVLMATRRLDTAAARTLGAAAGGDVVFYVSDAGAAGGGARVSAATLPDTPALRRAVAALGSATARNAPAPTVAIAGEPFYGLATPLRSADGRVLGGVAVLHSQAAELRPFRDLERTIVVAGLVGLALALPVSFVIARQITRPLAHLVAAARRAAAGDYSTDSGVRSRDEVGVLAEAFGTMLADLREKQVLVEFARLTPPRGARASPSSSLPPVQLDPLARAATAVADEATARIARRAVPEAAGAFAAAAALRPGQRFARRYAIHHMIGAGGAGVVFQATDTATGETIAIKVLRPDVLRNDPVSLDRLAREVDIVRRLSHPNIVQVYGIGEADGQHYITMELVEGSSLRELLDERATLPVPAVVTLGKQLCRALAHAHERGVIHRDVKPHNLVVTPVGVLKVMDFGTARLAETTRGLTESGVLFGTPAYMAPELLRNVTVDARADLYSAGVVLYEALVGRPPFVGAGSPLAVLTQALESSPTDPVSLNPAIPRALADVVLRTLAKDAAARPQSAADLESLLAAAALRRA